MPDNPDPDALEGVFLIEAHLHGPGPMARFIYEADYPDSRLQDVLDGLARGRWDRFELSRILRFLPEVPAIHDATDEVLMILLARVEWVDLPEHTRRFCLRRDTLKAKARALQSPEVQRHETVARLWRDAVDTADIVEEANLAADLKALGESAVDPDAHELVQKVLALIAEGQRDDRVSTWRSLAILAHALASVIVVTSRNPPLTAQAVQAHVSEMLKRYAEKHGVEQ